MSSKTNPGNGAELALVDQCLTAQSQFAGQPLYACPTRKDYILLRKRRKDRDDNSGGGATVTTTDDSDLSWVRSEFLAGLSHEALRQLLEKHTCDISGQKGCNRKRRSSTISDPVEGRTSAILHPDRKWPGDCPAVGRSRRSFWIGIVIA